MDYLAELFNFLNLDPSSPWSVFSWAITRGGFIFIIIVVVRGLLEVWLNWRQDLNAAKMKWVFIAIDVPPNSEQSPKAIEQIFNQLWGSLSGPNFIDKWWKGKFQTNFSLELVSIEGYIQYIIRAPKIFRDLVEAAVYAQYPDAQITEIEDYAQEITPENFRDQGYTLWGAQFKLNNSEVYPIKTYPQFEHSIAQTIVDPMANILEIFSRLGKGEQAWMQVLIKPVKDDWKDDSANEVKDLLGKEVETKKTATDKIVDSMSGVATKIGDQVFGAIDAGKEEKKDEPLKMLAMTAGERYLVESLERKAEKTGYKTKIRYIYLGKKGTFSKPRGVSGFTGALRQFALLNSNSFRPAPGTATKVEFFRTDARLWKQQKKILKNFKSRSQGGGVDDDGFVLNTEELATIYHFPYAGTTTASVRTADSKKGVAPMSLPVEEDEQPETPIETPSIEKKEGPPENLPV